MDLQYLRKIVKIFDESSADDLEIEEKGIKLKISKKNDSNTFNPQNYPVFNLGAQAQQAYPIAQTPVNQQAEAVKNHDTPAESTENKSSGLHTINSPIVGTFYRSPSPDSDSFVEKGQKVSKGQTLCIIEAMKLMNEIESDIDGIVEDILITNGEGVEFNQPLFLIKPV